MKNIYTILVVFFGLITNTNGQQIPATKQTKSILILNGFAHLGNGKVLENSAIGFKEGKIILVADFQVVHLTLQLTPLENTFILGLLHQIQL
jgi:hypothetical protein